MAVGAVDGGSCRISRGLCTDQSVREKEMSFNHLSTSVLFSEPVVTAGMDPGEGEGKVLGQDCIPIIEQKLI